MRDLTMGKLKTERSFCVWIKNVVIVLLWEFEMRKLDSRDEGENLNIIKSEPVEEKIHKSKNLAGHDG